MRVVWGLDRFKTDAESAERVREDAALRLLGVAMRVIFDEMMVFCGG